MFKDGVAEDVKLLQVGYQRFIIKYDFYDPGPKPGFLFAWIILLTLHLTSLMSDEIKHECGALSFACANLLVITSRNTIQFYTV